VGSLRKRKKAATRQRIADAAIVLFLQRGFDDVTISEIAEAADVSKVTIFNYFPRKEDIFFDRAPQAEQLFTTAIRDRPPGESPLRALRRLLLDHAEHHHPLGGFRDQYAYFWRTVQNSPALRSRAREAAEQLEDHLAGVLAEHSDDPHPRLTAALALAAYRSVYLTGITRILAGDNADDVTRDHITAVDHAFDVLENGLP
jgi:AcrR family transcriptional regulator